MKKLFKSILSFLTSALLIVCLTVPAFATTPEKTIHYYNDGSYLIETVSLEMPAISLCSTNKTKSKTATYYSKSNRNRNFFLWKRIRYLYSFIRYN